VDGRGVAVAFEGPAVDDFAAFLGDGFQFDEGAFWLEADLFFEFALGGGEGFFASLNFAFGDGPGAEVAVLPEGASRMREEKFQFVSPYAIHQQASADFCHGRNDSDFLGG